MMYLKIISGWSPKLTVAPAKKTPFGLFKKPANKPLETPTPTKPTVPTPKPTPKPTKQLVTITKTIETKKKPLPKMISPFRKPTIIGKKEEKAKPLTSILPPIKRPEEKISKLPLLKKPEIDFKKPKQFKEKKATVPKTKPKEKKPEKSIRPFGLDIGPIKKKLNPFEKPKPTPVVKKPAMPLKKTPKSKPILKLNTLGKKPVLLKKVLFLPKIKKPDKKAAFAKKPMLPKKVAALPKALTGAAGKIRAIVPPWLKEEAKKKEEKPVKKPAGRTPVKSKSLEKPMKPFGLDILPIKKFKKPGKTKPASSAKKQALKKTVKKAVKKKTGKKTKKKKSKLKKRVKKTLKRGKKKPLKKRLKKKAVKKKPKAKKQPVPQKKVIKKLKPLQEIPVIKRKPLLKEIKVPAMPKKKDLLESAPPEIKKAVKMAGLAKQAKGWYGDALQQEKSGTEGRLKTKRIKLSELKKRSKRGKLTQTEEKEIKRLEKDEKRLSQKLQEINKKTAALQKVDKKINSGEKQIVEKAKEAGVKIPKEALKITPKIELKTQNKEDFENMAGAIKAVAQEVAKAMTTQTATAATEKESIDIDDEIAVTEKMLKNLEFAFYKRKISFEQFRKKLFEYQTKLSELKLKKQLYEKQGRPTKRQVAAPKSVGWTTGFGPAGGHAPMPKPKPVTPKTQMPAGITPMFEEALERISKKVMAQQPTRAPVREKIIERIVEKPAPAQQGRQASWFETVRHPKAMPQGIAQRPAPAPIPRAPRSPYRTGPSQMATGFGNAIEERGGGSISRQQAVKMGEQLGELAEKYNIPKQKIVNQIQTLDRNKLMQDFGRIIKTVEEEETQGEEYKAAGPSTYEAGREIVQRQKKPKAGEQSEQELSKMKIETEFDKVLNLVKFKGALSADAVSKELRMSKKQVEEYAKILEQNKLIQLIYPPIGSMKLAYPGYLSWLAKEKKKKAEEKKKKRKK